MLTLVVPQSIFERIDPCLQKISFILQTICEKRWTNISIYNYTKLVSSWSTTLVSRTSLMTLYHSVLFIKHILTPWLEIFCTIIIVITWTISVILYPVPSLSAARAIAMWVSPITVSIILFFIIMTVTSVIPTTPVIPFTISALLRLCCTKVVSVPRVRSIELRRHPWLVTSQCLVHIWVSERILYRLWWVVTILRSMTDGRAVLVRVTVMPEILHLLLLLLLLLSLLMNWTWNNPNILIMGKLIKKSYIFHNVANCLNDNNKSITKELVISGAWTVEILFLWK